MPIHWHLKVRLLYVLGEDLRFIIGNILIALLILSNARKILVTGVHVYSLNSRQLKAKKFDKFLLLCFQKR